MSEQSPERASERERPIDRRGLMAGAAALGVGGLTAAAFGQSSSGGRGPRELTVVWTSPDPDVAHRVGLMYTHAAKTAGWFERVRLIAWGPSQRTLVGDKDLRAKVKEMQDDGVTLDACIACAESYGIVEELRAAGFEVRLMGGPLTQSLKDPDVAVLTF